MRVTGLALVMLLGAALSATAQPYNTTQGLEKLISEKAAPYILVDVRTPEEFESGAIPTAVNIPYDSIVDKAPTQDKGALVIVYCRSGSRSSMAASMLKRAGYTNVVDFGGISKWKGQVVKP